MLGMSVWVMHGRYQRLYGQYCVLDGATRALAWGASALVYVGIDEVAGQAQRWY